jgi:arylsulfatase A
MALVHSPFVHPPKLEKLARSKFTDDLDKKTVAFGHMITYMDHIVGSILARLKKHDLDQNTLVLFTGDNGTHKNITSRLSELKLKGGKGSMTEAGSRVPLLARWPGTIPPGAREEFFCLVDVLPTIASLADIRLTQPVDGLDLSHNLLGKNGKDRKRVLINYGRGYFVREKRFRLNQDGKLYDIPVASDATRYSEKATTDPKHDAHRHRLQALLNQFMAIKNEYGTDKPTDHQNKKKK